MRRKGLSDTWIEWIMKAVCGGKVAVNLNGELGHYFRSYKGLRQGGPLSPLLFNLVVDGLSGILSKASTRCVIEGVTPHLVEGKAIAYKVLGFLSQWKKMLKPKEVLLMEDLILKLQEGLMAW
jgi:hypothetical protein